MEERPVLWISVTGLVFFGILHAWMRYEGASDIEIRNVLLGWLAFAAFCSFWSAMWHGGGFGLWLLIIVPLSLSCGASILAIDHPVLAAAIVLAVAALSAWLAYLKYLDTPYGPLDRPVRNIPGIGAVVLSGKTPRHARAEVARLKQKYKQ